MTPVAVFWQTVKAFKVNLMISIVSSSVVKWRLWRRHGGMAWRIFEKTPPNSGGVAGFKWRHHGGHHRLNGGGGMAVMAEETFFF